MYAFIPQEPRPESFGPRSFRKLFREGEMGRSIAKGCLLALVVGICTLGPASAQNRDQAWEVMPYVGSVRFGDATSGTNLPDPGDVILVEFDDDLSFGFRFGYHYSRKQMVEFWFSTLGTEARTTLLDASDLDPMMQPIAKPTTIEADFLSLHINYVYNFFLHHRDKVVAYVTGGLGINNLSSFGSDPDPEIQKMLSQLIGEENNITYNFGGGLRIFANKKIGVRFDLRQVAYEVNATDSDDYLEFQVGVTLILGGP